MYGVRMLHFLNKKIDENSFKSTKYLYYTMALISQRVSIQVDATFASQFSRNKWMSHFDILQGSW